MKRYAEETEWQREIGDERGKGDGSREREGHTLPIKLETKPIKRQKTTPTTPMMFGKRC